MDGLNLPIKHISYSALKLYCSNPQQFFKNYVLGVWDDYKQSVSAFVGAGFHKAMEVYYTTNDYDKGIEAGLKWLEQNERNVDFGKTGSMAKALSEYTQTVQMFEQEKPVIEETLGTEVTIVTEEGIENSVLPLPIKVKADLVARVNGGIDIFDWKVVTSFTDKEEENPEYIMQAMFNFIGMKAKFKEAPKKMTFVEIKKTASRSGEPQVQYYEISFDNHPEYRNAFTKLYGGFIKNIARDDFVYLPNFGDFFSAKESWKDFTADVIDFTKLPAVSHKSSYQKTTKEVEFSKSKLHDDETLTNEEKIKLKLQEFGVPVKMEQTHKGLNVTLYTMKVSRGVKMNQILQYTNDIALALEAKSVRIEAPIAGTSLVGIEVSNKEQGSVTWSEELLQKGTLNIPVGVDVYGKTTYLDLTKAPHLLIGGTTGSGKSVFMNVVINSLIKQNDPDDLQLVLIDPKRTEFVEFEEVPHLAHEIITESDQADATLRWAVEEMEERYKLLRKFKVKTLAEYRKNALDIPYTVIVIDELADLMLSSTTRDTIETSIVRLAQKARAVGIHLVVATQRPSVDVITGLIKANFPTRVAFMVSTGVDSRVVIDDIGAEKLIGAGDLLFMNPRNQGLERLQGYFI